MEDKDKAITVGYYPCEIIDKQENKMFVKRTDTIKPVYEIWKICNGNNAFYKTHRDYALIKDFYNRL